MMNYHSYQHYCDESEVEETKFMQKLRHEISRKAKTKKDIEAYHTRIEKFVHKLLDNNRLKDVMKLNRAPDFDYKKNDESTGEPSKLPLRDLNRSKSCETSKLLSALGKNRPISKSTLKLSKSKLTINKSTRFDNSINMSFLENDQSILPKIYKTSKSTIIDKKRINDSPLMDVLPYVDKDTTLRISYQPKRMVKYKKSPYEEESMHLAGISEDSENVINLNKLKQFYQNINTDTQIIEKEQKYGKILGKQNNLNRIDSSSQSNLHSRLQSGINRTKNYTDRSFTSRESGSRLTSGRTYLNRSILQNKSIKDKEPSPKNATSLPQSKFKLYLNSLQSISNHLPDVVGNYEVAEKEYLKKMNEKNAAISSDQDDNVGKQEETQMKKFALPNLSKMLLKKFDIKQEKHIHDQGYERYSYMTYQNENVDRMKKKHENF